MSMCSHPDREPVALTTGQVVAQLCVLCGQRLAPEFGCAECEYVTLKAVGGPEFVTVIGRCDTHSRNHHGPHEESTL